MWGERESYFRQAVFTQFARNDDELVSVKKAKSEFISLA